MLVRRTLFAAAATLALAAPALAQYTATDLTVSGPSALGGVTTMWTREFQQGAPLTLDATFLNNGKQSLSLTFSDPADVADFWIADAGGNYVAALSVTGAATVTVADRSSMDFPCPWDETDWYGQPLPAGIYSVEAQIEADQGPYAMDKVYFTIGQVISSGNDFSGAVKLSASKARPGQPVQCSLLETNMTGAADVLGAGGPFLPEKISCEIRDASGNAVWTWHAMIPMIFTGPANDFVAAGDTIEYGPVTFPGVDANGNALPAGAYTVVMRYVGGFPKQAEVSAKLRIAGKPVKQGTIDAQGAGSVDVHAGGAASSKVLAQLSDGADVTVLTEGRSWDLVEGTDPSGNAVHGWVRKGFVHVK